MQGPAGWPTGLACGPRRPLPPCPPFAEGGAQAASMNTSSSTVPVPGRSGQDQGPRAPWTPPKPGCTECGPDPATGPLPGRGRGEREVLSVRGLAPLYGRGTGGERLPATQSLQAPLPTREGAMIPVWQGSQAELRWGCTAPTQTPLSSPEHRLRSSRPRDRSLGGHPGQPAQVGLCSSGESREGGSCPRSRCRPRRAHTPMRGEQSAGVSAHPRPHSGRALGSRRTRLCPSRPTPGPRSARWHTSPPHSPHPGGPGTHLHLRAPLRLPRLQLWGLKDHRSWCGHEESLVHKCVLGTSSINMLILSPFSLFH